MIDPITVNTTQLLAAFRANLDALQARRHDPITVDGLGSRWNVESIIAWGGDLVVVITDDAARALSIGDFVSRATMLAASTPQFRPSRPVSVERPGSLDGGPIRWIEVDPDFGVRLRLDEQPPAPEGAANEPTALEDAGAADDPADAPTEHR